MSLEATMIIVDNSESSRNGDYTSTRWQAQVDAVSIIHSVKMRVHPQSAVGLMSMGGNGPEVLSTFTSDFGSILAGLHRTKIHGTSHLSSSIQVAGLALKHRSEKSQRQRIIVFSCSPIHEDEKTLVKLAKKMKKNNVSIDVVAFGDLESDQTKKLEAFVDNVTSGEGSCLAIIPPGPHLLSEELQQTQILAGEGAGAAAPSGGEGGEAGGFNFEDAAEDDPELAFALRLSLEEEKNRQDKEKRDREEQEGKTELGGIPEEGQGESSDKKDDDKMDTA
ncbi:26S proteasome non-ATPase regulatory subunit [Penicillium sp. IBT 35674x]|uniref:26S proteasome non-ATPase regulatory subunit n=1 Tax=Penicillium frequentans TaxID=3151616 RepID=A0AAD6GH00_9EURO|nr:26S proteasome non-ATPase regulatory subunit [Penicillium pulvis]KAJ5528310.1 26S proteasome non-ATPase regulatory subunit [Penicillium glabrum]KAJ5547365.1 26S proteasome non-ATPase regulatory subunit [Penicillium glabrum]KAJ5801930.1 26S proteasome non-ATPase regulatory subunit [Penicillium pulvis]KAJ6006867.1 26S proteasome non-ATPase regulatory subunit [Penicillium sp. IBT 35674x]